MMFRSNHNSRRWTKPTFEFLEGRTLLSATPLLPEPTSLLPGHDHLSFERVHAALQVLESQLTVPSLAAVAGSPTQDPLSIDLDQDGVLDTVVLSRSSGGKSSTLQVYFGESTLHPAMAREMVLDHVATQLIVADSDGDGRLDIFAQEGIATTGTLLFGRPDELFDAYRHHASHPTFAVADLNGDGVDEFVYGQDKPGIAGVALVQGTWRQVIGMSELPAVNVQLADLDGDGKTDLAMSEGDGSLAVFAGLGNGQFASQSEAMPDIYAGTGPIHLAFARLADRITASGSAYASPLDMVVASSSRSEVAVFYGEENWRFRPGQVMRVGQSPSSVSVFDVTNDGILDLVVTSAGSNTIWILRGLGDGRFDDTHPWILTTGEEPLLALAGHFSAKEGIDLVSLDRQSNDLTYYRNVAGGASEAERFTSGGTGPIAAVVRDVNGDGYDDLIVANHDDGRVTLFYGSPEGLHESQTIERVGTHPSALAFGPGLQSSYQVYVLDDGSDQALILSFAPPEADVLPTETVEAPKLETTAEVRIFLQPVSETTADSLPILLVAPSESEESSLGGGQAHLTVPTPASSAKNEEKLDDTLPLETSPELSSEASSPSEIAAQRYLLGTDDAAAPDLEPASMSPSAVPEARSETEVGSSRAEPSASGIRTNQAIEPDVVEFDFDELGEATNAREAAVLVNGDVLVGVLLILGMPRVWAEQSRISSLHPRSR